jgi:hypothetical protein
MSASDPKRMTWLHEFARHRCRTQRPPKRGRIRTRKPQRIIDESAAYRHHHVNVMREFALYDFETGPTPCSETNYWDAIRTGRCKFALSAPMFSKLCILGRSDARGHEEDDRRSDVMNVKNNHDLAPRKSQPRQGPVTVTDCRPTSLAERMCWPRV